MMESISLLTDIVVAIGITLGVIAVVIAVI